jgi:hypothetical protein
VCSIRYCSALAFGVAQLAIVSVPIAQAGNPTPMQQAADSTPIPPEVARFVKPGSIAISVKKGDVNGDGVLDYLVALESTDPPHERELIVLVRQKGGELKSAASNTTILPCSIVQGAGGGIRLQAKGRGFEVEVDYGSGSVGGAKIFNFQYVAKERTWVLIEVEEDSDDQESQPPEHVKDIEKPYMHGTIERFGEFKGDGCTI